MQRLWRDNYENYSRFGFTDDTGRRMAQDHGTLVRLLDGTRQDLAK